MAAEFGLDSPKAQRLFDMHQAQLAAADKARDESTKSWIANQRQEWRKSLAADKDFGGANQEKNMAAVKRTFAKYGAGDAELKAFLNDGAGDHPALVKLFARIGADLAEDTVAPRGVTGARSNGASADLRQMFDKSPELFT